MHTICRMPHTDRRAATIRLSTVAWAALDTEAQRRGMSRPALIEALAVTLGGEQAVRDDRLDAVEARLRAVEAAIARLSKISRG